VPTSEPTKIEICVDAWIIQDGNYPDFHVGETLRCALEFYGEFRMAAQSTPSLVHVKDSTYQVCAQVIFCSSGAWAIDFGLPAFQDHPPPALASGGAWIEGEINLGIDPFFYKETLVRECGMPDLFVMSTIASITRDDTPWIKSADGKFFARDPDQPRWTAVQQTDAWNDDDGRSSYLLGLWTSRCLSRES